MKKRSTTAGTRLEQERRRLMRWAKAVSDPLNSAGEKKRRGPKPKAVTKPAAKELRKFGIGSEEGEEG